MQEDVFEQGDQCRCCESFFPVNLGLNQLFTANAKVLALQTTTHTHKHKLDCSGWT